LRVSVARLALQAMAIVPAPAGAFSARARRLHLAPGALTASVLFSVNSAGTEKVPVFMS
jgi:hypothetical protein